MSDYVISIIRTVVPAVTGLLIAWLLQLGIDIDEGALSAVINGLLVGAWYAFARWLEEKFTWADWILGVKKTPTY